MKPTINAIDQGAALTPHHAKYFAWELTRALKPRQIEPEVLERMFSMKDV